MSDAKWRLVITGAVILACSICYFVGRKSQAAEDRLAENHAQTVKHDSVTKAVTAHVDSVEKKSDILIKYRDNLRAKIVVSHDSVILHDTVIVNHEIAQLITADDTLPKTLANERAAHKEKVAALLANIADRDQRIALLESQHNPRLSHGFQVGGGYCQTATGQTPCAYVGYGFSLRIP